MPRRVLTVLIALSSLLSACSSQAAGKGPEEEVPGDGKLDSFRAPTAHGSLTFALPSNAQFTEDERFHTWTFTLTGAARVEFTTASSFRNMDTVLYVYRRGENSWGSYIHKADDDGDNLLASYGDELAAGEYRILVKAYKEQIRGPFTLNSRCDGEGCPAPGDGSFSYEWPRETGFSVGCATRIDDVLRSGVYSKDAYTVKQSEVNQLTGSARIAVEGLLKHTDLEDYEDIYVDVLDLDGGSLVSANTGSDWGYQYLFEDADTLLYERFEDQSPEAYYFCQAPGEATLDLDDHDEGTCVGSMANRLASDEDDAMEHSETYAGVPSETLPSIVYPAIVHYISEVGEAEGGEVEVSIISWPSEDNFDDQGAVIDLRSAGKPIYSYVVGIAGSYGADWLYLVYPEGSDPVVLCEEQS